MENLSDLIKVPEEKFTGDEEGGFSPPTDAILSALDRLDAFSASVRRGDAAPSVDAILEINKGKDLASPAEIKTKTPNILNMDSATTTDAPGGGGGGGGEGAGDQGSTAPVDNTPPVTPAKVEASGGEQEPPAKRAKVDTSGSKCADTPAEETEMTDFEKRLREDPIDHEIHVPDLTAISATPPSRPAAPKKKRIQRSNLDNDPRWLEPFQTGWRRELVLRKTVEGEEINPDVVKGPCDVYYFGPDNKKLRSLVQLGEYLTKTGSPYTTANFSFARRQIYEEPYDTVRSAAAGRGSRGRGTGASPRTPGSSAGGASPAASSPGRGRGRGRGAGRGRGRGRGSTTSPARSPGATFSPTDFGLVADPRSPGYMVLDSTVTPKPTPPAPPRSSGKSRKKYTSPAIITDLTLDDSSDDDKPLPPPRPAAPKNVVHIAPKPVPPPPVPHMREPTTAAVRPKKAVAKKRTTPRPDSNGSTFSSRNRDSYAPPEKRQKTGYEAHSLNANTMLCGLACPGQEDIPPTLHCNMCMMLFHPACVNHDGALNEPFSCNACLSSRLGGSGQAMQPAAAVQSRPQPPPRPKPPQSDVSTVDLSKIINQVSGQLLTLPPGVLNHLDMSQPLALKVNNKVLMIPPNCFISSDLAVKVFLPPGTLPNALFREKNTPVNFNFYAKNNEQILNFTEIRDGEPPSKPTMGGENDKNNAMQPSAAEDGVTDLTEDGAGGDSISKVPGRISRKQAKVMNPNECHFQKLHSGYDCMVRIFRYLKIADLLRAARVCRTWAKVASQDSLWKIVKLRGSRVSDWEQAGRTFRNHNTWALDLQGMLYFEDQNRTWHQFTAVLDSLDNLRKITFGQSPASMMHAVAEKLDKLEHLSAEFITDILPEAQMWSTNTKLDLGKFANLKNLEVLRLRGVCGIVLPAFSFSGGLADLSGLTNLRTLVLTTLRNVHQSEFTFLKSLTNLETLEIGDCTTWTSEVYGYLKELTKLKRIRLEGSGENPAATMADALKGLQHLEKLELVKFAVDVAMGGVLKELTMLKTLSIWPDLTKNAAMNNTNTYKAIRPLTFLQNIDWGIMPGDNSIVLKEEEGSSDQPSATKGEASTEATANSEEGKKKVECIAFLDDPKEPVKDGEVAPQMGQKFISVSKLLDELGGALPSTKIRIFKVPAVAQAKSLGQ